MHSGNAERPAAAILRLEVARSPEAAGELAGALAGAALARAIRRRGRACLALSGGRSPAPLFAALARQSLDWPALHVFQVDERQAPPGDPARNLTLIEEALVDRGPLPPRNLHPMPVDHADPDAAANKYAAELARCAGHPPVLDVVALGLGRDGHTASLFPGDPALIARGMSVLCTREHDGYRRLTLSLPLINRAREILWFVTGREKSEILAELLAGTGLLPAMRVSRRRAVVVADAAALHRWSASPAPG